MKSHALWAAAIVSLAGAMGGASGCLERPLCPSADEAANGDEPCRPRTTNQFVETIRQNAVDKLDLLFMIDNSMSMADKQAVLAEAVPDLVERLVNPVCIDNTGGLQPVQPVDPETLCDQGFKREFNPIKDIHIGVVSSSIEDYTAPDGSPRACSPQRDVPTEFWEQSNDMAHLIGARPRAITAALNLASGPEGTPGFLDWKPAENPQTVESFKSTFQALVPLVGEFGCGYESSLEAWYRFLVDPEPPAGVRYEPCPGQNGAPCAVPFGPDPVILAQRAEFLRPDSLVAVIMLTDENDCSIQNRGQLSYIADPSFAVPVASSACAANPNDPCCYNCAFGAPSGCAADPACGPPPPTYTPNSPEDRANLRCFDQKRRFGEDFLYPTKRYVSALTSLTLCMDRADLDPNACGNGRTVPNPLFVREGSLGVRSSQLVFLAGIIGVPWQDIETRADGEGEPIVDPTVLRYKTAKDMRNDGTWDVILGEPHNPAGPIPPRDALMVESIAPRSGMNPVTGDVLAAPGAGYLANRINGHEWTNPTGADLQYACIFPLAAPRLCETIPDYQRCDCEAADIANDQNPLCQGQDNQYSTSQRFAKAYPGLRHLEVLKDFGDNAIVASICARNLDPQLREQPDYGYRPAITAIVDRLKETFGGACLPRELSVDPVDGSVPCSVIEARLRDERGCDLPGRRNPRPEVIEPSFKRLKDLASCDDEQVPCDASTFTLCEIERATDDTDQDGRVDCVQDIPQTDIGWCYVDPEKTGADPVLVERCKATERRLVRLVDPNPSQTPAPGAMVLIACVGESFEE